MNYWHILAKARRSLLESHFREAEEAFERAAVVRQGDKRRVFILETIPDAMQRAWRKIRHRDPGIASADVQGLGAGRWERTAAQFRETFKARSESVLQRAERQLEAGVAADPAAAADLLAEAMYLSVASMLAPRRLPASRLLTELFELLPHSGRLCAHDLVTRDLDLPAAVRLRLADRSLSDLAQLPRHERSLWADTILVLLDDQTPDWQPGTGPQRRWMAARLADRYVEEAAEVIARWQVCDEPEQPESNRRWSRLRRLEILAGRDPRRLAAPSYGEAHRLAGLLTPAMNDQEEVRCREAMSMISFRRPATHPSKAWATATTAEDGSVLAVFWWADEPRDVACWHPTEDKEVIREFLEAVGGRVLWSDQEPSLEESAWLPESFQGKRLRPYLETILEPLIPIDGWNIDVARVIALGRCGAWRSGWRADLGHPLLVPPGQDGMLSPSQEEIEPILHVGLLWLAILHRINTADPSLRAGLGELSRRGDPAAAFLYEHAVLGVPERAAVDAGFTAWTMPLLWSRSDPLSRFQPDSDAHAEQLDLQGHDVAVVVTGKPSHVLSAWGAGVLRWRCVLDRPGRIVELRRLARECYGPVTLVPRGGKVHDMAAALTMLDELAAAAFDAPAADQMLAINHWIRLVETHNGDLLDQESLRSRPAGVYPWLDRYADLVRDLPYQSIAFDDSTDDDCWAAQYIQRARRSGLVAGLVDDLSAASDELDAVWGIYDGSDASWVFLDSAAVHWSLLGQVPETLPSLHRLLASRGRRHLSLLSGRGLFFEDLARWLDRTLAPYGQPYHRDLRDARPPLLKLAGGGPLPGSQLVPGAFEATALRYLGEDGAEVVVHIEGHGTDAAFWRAAAAGAFGPVNWRLSDEGADNTGWRRIVPLWSTLADAGPILAPQEDTVPAWRLCDARRTEHLGELRCLLALECCALLASDSRQVEILDGRWWRIFGPLDQILDFSGDGNGLIEILDLSIHRRGEQRSPLEQAAAAWYVEHGRVAGQLSGWNGPLISESRPPARSGVYHHIAPAEPLWRDLASDLLRTWDLGRPVGRLLVIGNNPPQGAAAVSALCAGPGATVLPDRCGDQELGAMVWARFSDLADYVTRGGRLPTFDRVLLLDFSSHCPPSPGAADRAWLLAWLAQGAARRLDLVGDLRRGPWLHFFAESMAVTMSEDDPPVEWGDLRRGVSPQTMPRCPQCDERAPCAGEVLICRLCSYDLAGPGPRPQEQGVVASRVNGLIGQTDLGRQEPLEVWADPIDAEETESHLLDHGAEPNHEDHRAWRLRDGRQWRLRDLSHPLAVSAGPAVLLRPIDDPNRLRPWSTGGKDASLTMLYERHEIIHARRDSRLAETKRFLELLRHPLFGLGPAEQDREYGIPHLSALTFPVWRLAWMSGRAVSAVRRDLDLLRWASILMSERGDVPDDPQHIGRESRIQACWLVNVSLRDTEQELATLASRMESQLDEWLAGGVPGAWQCVHAPGASPANAVVMGKQLPVLSMTRLDVLLAVLAASCHESGPRLVYSAPQGAWFSSRRLVGWLGEKTRLVDGLRKQLENLACLVRDSLSGSSLVDTGFVLDARTAQPVLSDPLGLLLNVLGFWSRLGPAGPEDIAFLELDRLRRSTALDINGTGARLLLELAEAQDLWRESLERTPAGGRIVSMRPPAPRRSDKPRAPRWKFIERGTGGFRQPLRHDVAAWAAAEAPSRMVLAGIYGSGRTGSIMAGLALSDDGKQATFWCPDESTAVRLHMEARRLDPAWQPDLRIPAADRLPPNPPVRAPGEHGITIVAELQRWPRDLSYLLQEQSRNTRLLLSVDIADLQPATTWEDLFLTVPGRGEVRYLKTQMLQAAQLWRVAGPLLPAGLGEHRTKRRERGSVFSRLAGTLEECAAAVDAASAADRLGKLVSLILPLPEDLTLLARAMSDRGWIAVFERDLRPLLMPGVTEALAAHADAHRFLHGSWPGVSVETVTTRHPTILSGFLPSRERAEYERWLKELPQDVLKDTSVFYSHLRRSPWGTICCGRPEAREAIEPLVEAAKAPLDLLSPGTWEAWRRRVDMVLGRPLTAAGPAVACLAGAAEAPGEPNESLAYICFGPEPITVHRRVIMRATDRLLVLYQEHSPLPDQWES